MKYRVFSVLMIMALLASLCVITVAMPSAASANVDAATVTPAPTTAGSTAGYKVVFHTGSPSATLTAGQDTVTIAFPTGTTVPASMDYRNITVNGTALGVNGVSVSGQSVTLITPVSVSQGGTVTVNIASTEGLKNPKLSMEPSTGGGDGIGSTGYKLKVSTSKETTPVDSSAYYIYNWAQADKTAAAQGQAVTVTGAGFAPNTSVSLNSTGAVMGSGTTDSDGTFTINGFATGLGGTSVATDGTGRSAATGTISTLPSISVSKSAANIGQSFTIYGYDFSGTATLASAHFSMGGQSLTASSITASDLDSDGTVDDFVAAVSVPMALSSGQKTVSVIDPGRTGSPSASTKMDVNPYTISIDPASSGPGTSVVVTGAGWPPSASGGSAGILLFAYSAGRQAAIGDGAVETDGTGAFTEAATIPTDATAGTRAIVCTFGGGAATATQVFTVTPTALTLTPDSGPKGTIVTVGGGPLTANSSIAASSLKFGGAAWNTSAISLDSQGYLTPTNLTVASTASEGANTVSATDGASRTASATFTVTKPTATLDVSEAARGQLVTVTGSGWLPGALGVVTITLNSVTMGIATPDSDGDIYKQFNVPTNLTPNTTYSYSASDGNGNSSLSGTLKVKQAKVTVDPTSGPVGSTITITGSGFLPQAGVSALTMGGVSLIAGQSLLTDSVGSFETTATVPGLAQQGWAITATVDVSASTSFSVTAGAAAAVTPATGLATISDYLAIAWTFDATSQTWQVYDPTEGATSDMTEMKKGQGYWIKVSEDCTLTYGAETYNLKAGWNLIGWLG